MVNTATLGAIGETEITQKDFKTPYFDIAAYLTDDDGTFKGDISVGFEKPTQKTFDVVFDLHMASDGQVPDYDGTLEAKKLTKSYSYS